MESICGADCSNCGYGKNKNCKGCVESKGCPFGKECFIAKYIKTGGIENYNIFKKQLIEEFNLLNIPGMPKINELYPLNGAFVNLSYPIPNGSSIKFLDDCSIYLGNQVECEFNEGNIIRCYGLVAGMDFLLVSEYGANGDNPEIIIYKKR
ncbi:MAG: DUF3795 domain-containing protein [Clostridia bacterium]|nr:DUF3795 domain-containing protein [Clostridia bacterium]MBP3596545.1 DUF3795 domain-containing protein [Clostridia bacterium]